MGASIFFAKPGQRSSARRAGRRSRAARRRWSSRGATYVEYLIVIALVALAGLAAFRAFGSAVAERSGAESQSVLTLEGAPGRAPPISVSRPEPGASDRAPGAAAPGVQSASLGANTDATSLALTDDRHGGSDSDPATSVSSPISSKATTDASYSVGPPSRPQIHYDNGFLQNPNDPKDETPLPTRAPTDAERDAYDEQVRKARLALAAIKAGVPWAPGDAGHALKLPDGVEAYNHFLTGDGADSSFSYDKFVNDDASGKVILQNAIGDTQRSAEDIYNQMLAQDPSLAGKTVKFQITGGPIPVGSGEEGLAGRYPYPDTENWQKAIGAHEIWNSAEVTVTPPSSPSGKPTFTMKYTLHGEDRYNFNPGAHDIATGQPDSDNGRFEVSGLAKQYMNYGALDRNVSWTAGDIAGSTKTETQGR